MAKFTMTLRLLTQSCDIGLQDYPIWKEEYRARLNRLIVNHFMFREISAESPTQFIFWLNAKMDEIMPYYNALYQLQDTMDFTKMYNVDWSSMTYQARNENKHTEVATEAETNGRTTASDVAHTVGETSSTNDETTTSKDRYSDTPQGMIAQTGQGFAGNTYLTNATDRTDVVDADATSSSESDSTSSSENISSDSRKGSEDRNVATDGTTNGSMNKFGLDGKTPAEVFKEYLDALKNIDLMVLRELEPLFIQVLS